MKLCHCLTILCLFDQFLLRWPITEIMVKIRLRSHTGSGSKSWNWNQHGDNKEWMNSMYSITCIEWQLLWVATSIYGHFSSWGLAFQVYCMAYHNTVPIHILGNFNGHNNKKKLPHWLPSSLTSTSLWPWKYPNWAYDARVPVNVEGKNGSNYTWLEISYIKSTYAPKPGLCHLDFEISTTLVHMQTQYKSLKKV